MKYKVGDRVRIVDQWVEGCCQNTDGRMDHWLGQIMTIRDVRCDSYKMEEDKEESYRGGGWYWSEACIVGLADETPAHRMTLEEFFASDKEIAIRCATIDEAVILFSNFIELGKTWRTSDSYSIDRLNYEYGDNTAYSNKGSYGRATSYRDRGDTVIDFCDMDISAQLSAQYNIDVLLRSDYVWRKAMFDTKNGTLRVADIGTVTEQNIVAIENDCRKDYVRCKCCKEIIRNDEATIAEHIRNAVGEAKCLKCRYLKTKNESNEAKQFVKREDGKYDVVRTSVAELWCHYGDNCQISAEGAFSQCRFAACATGEFDNMGGFFVRYPEAFNKIVTVDALDPQTWEFYEKNGNSVYLKAKKRFSLRAKINKLGIIDSFMYRTRTDEATLVYSDKYGKLFRMTGNGYDELPDWIGNVRKNELLKTISEIYKEKDHE